MDEQTAYQSLLFGPPLSPFFLPPSGLFVQLCDCELFTLPLFFISCVSSSLPLVFSRISFSSPYSSPQPVHNQSSTSPPKHATPFEHQGWSNWRDYAENQLNVLPPPLHRQPSQHARRMRGETRRKRIEPQGTREKSRVSMNSMSCCMHLTCTTCNEDRSPPSPEPVRRPETPLLAVTMLGSMSSSNRGKRLLNRVPPNNTRSLHSQWDEAMRELRGHMSEPHAVDDLLLGSRVYSRSFASLS